MAIPLLLVVCVNSLGLDAIETPFFTVPKLLQDRTGEVGFPLAALKGKLAALLRVLTTDRIFGSSQHFWNLYQVYGGVDAALMQIPDELQDREIYIPDEIGEIYFLSHPLSPEEVLTYCDAYGMVRDYGRLHFRQPQQYEPEMILILNENNGFCPETLWGEAFREEKVGHYRLLYGQ